MTSRNTDTRLDPLFLARWSPRAFDRSLMPDDDLATIIDAARFAPSAMNYQPWHILYAKRDDVHWAQFLSFLMPGNALWAQNASVLLYILSDRTMGDRPSMTHSFDAGAAWAMLALQATMLGYQSHAMAGVDFQAAAQGLDVPDQFKIEVAVALGRIGDRSSLPQALQAREVPSDRKPRAEMAWSGPFAQI